MNTVAYIQGYLGQAIKEAAKVDKLFQAGKLSAKDWQRHVWDHFKYTEGVKGFEGFDRLGRLGRALQVKRVPVSGLDAKKGVVPRYLKELRAIRKEYADHLPALVSKGLSRELYYPAVIPDSKPPIRRLPVRTPPDTWEPGYYSTDIPWGSKNNIGDKYRANYTPRTESIKGALPGTPVYRHELGHWAEHQLAHRKPKLYEALRARLFGALYENEPTYTARLIQDDTLPGFASEAMGHYLGARKGVGGARLRAATAEGWTSELANRVRKLYPRDPALASTVEHMQRNYKQNLGLAGRPGAPLTTEYARPYSDII